LKGDSKRRIIPKIGVDYQKKDSHVHGFTVDRNRPAFGHRWQLAAGLALCAVSLAGCGDDDYKGIRRSNVVVETKPTFGGGSRPMSGAELVYGEGSVPKSTTAALGAAGPVGEPDAENERIGRGDIYYKLAWIKQKLDSGYVPDNLHTALDDIRKRTAKLTPDENILRIQEATEKLQAGLDAHRMEQQLRREGVNPDGVAWGVGRMELERRLKRGSQKSAFGSGAGSDRLTSTDREILTFAAEHSAPPSRVKWSAFRDASAKIAELGDKLGLTDKIAR
jgi:hypothetical protein